MSFSGVLGAADQGSDAMFGKEVQSPHDSTKRPDLHSYLLGSGLSSTDKGHGVGKSTSVCHQRMSRTKYL